MLKKHPAIGRLVQLPAKIVSIVGFGNGYFAVKVGTKKPEKVSESFMMEHGVLIKKEWQEKTKTGELKPVPIQEYVNRHFQELFENRRQIVLEGKVFEGYKIEDEVIEGFEAIAEE